MGKKKEYTIKEISEEMGVTKSAIQQKMDKKFRDKFTSKKTINNRVTVLISYEGYLQLKQSSKKKKDNQNKNDNDVIDTLKEQLKKKDEQIEKLQILLNQSQQLQLKQNEKIELLESQSKIHWWQKIFK